VPNPSESPRLAYRADAEETDSKHRDAGAITMIGKMRIVQYKPGHFGALRQFVDRVGQKMALTHASFVNYYYATRDSCRLYLYVADDESILATYGVENMRFEYNGRETTIGFGSNFHSLKPAAGGVLFVHARKSSAIGLVYGGTPDSHKMTRYLKWTYYQGVTVYDLNRGYEANLNDSWFRLAAKSMARQIPRANLSSFVSRIPAEVREQVSVQEESVFREESVPSDSPFIFRFAPTVEYLNWRYSTALRFIRYRLIRILNRGRTAGYAVINEGPEKLILAHCDGTDPRILAYGVLLSVLHVGRQDRKPRSVVLACCHPAMQEIYQRFGFRTKYKDHPFCIGTLHGPVDFVPDTSHWLVNYDWGDRGLRPPFLDQS
jgi:hypothetical protein